jgi:hypothetical protein
MRRGHLTLCSGRACSTCRFGMTVSLCGDVIVSLFTSYPSSPSNLKTLHLPLPFPTSHALPLFNPAGEDTDCKYYTVQVGAAGAESRLLFVDCGGGVLLPFTSACCLAPPAPPALLPDPCTVPASAQSNFLSPSSCIPPPPPPSVGRRHSGLHRRLAGPHPAGPAGRQPRHHLPAGQRLRQAARLVSVPGSRGTRSNTCHLCVYVCGWGGGGKTACPG